MLCLLFVVVLTYGIACCTCNIQFVGPVVATPSTPASVSPAMYMLPRGMMRQQERADRKMNMGWTSKKKDGANHLGDIAMI